MAFRARYGRRITFMGGVDTIEVMARGTPATVMARVKAAIDSLGRGGGLIVEPDQRITMPEENVRALVETARLYGGGRPAS